MIVQMGGIVAGDSTKRFMGDGGFVPNAVVWHYMELWKFRDLLESQSLFFTRLTNFRDGLEGTSPAMLPLVQTELIRAAGGDVDAHLELAERWHVATTSRTLANCWNERPAESMGFWERYAGGLQGRAGVALVSTQGALQEALGEKALISRIRYIDFATAPEYSSNPLHRGITKSLEYSDVRTNAAHSFTIFRTGTVCRTGIPYPTTSVWGIM